MSLSHIATHDGYWALGALIGIEALGIPIPGETFLIAAGTYAGQSHKLSLWLIWLVAALSVIVGSTISYWLGVKGGYRLLRKYGRYIHMNDAELKVGRYVFDKYGAAVVSVGRFVAVLRTYAPFLAGSNRMRWPRFLIFNTVGAVAWSGLWAILSYELGSSLKSASSKVDAAVGVVAVILVVAVIVVVRRQAKRLEAIAEAAYPGPLTD